MFLHLLKMIIRRRLKRGFVTLLVASLLIVTITFFLELVQHFVGRDNKPKSASYWKSIALSSDKLPKSKINAEKAPYSVSNCDYNVCFLKARKIIS